MTDRGIRTHDPIGVGGVQVHRAAKGARPILHAGVVMRMRDRDRLQAAQGANQHFGRIVQQRNAVPENVAPRGAQQQRALADTESGMGMDLEQIGFQAPPGVDVAARKPRWRGPDLSALRHELPLASQITQPAGGAGVSG